MGAHALKQRFVEKLSDREIEVLQFLAAGMSIFEISKQLGLTEITINLISDLIVRKLGAAQMSEAMIMALDKGYLQLH